VKKTRFLFIALLCLAIAGVIGCASKPKATFRELESKGSPFGASAPEWIRNYVSHGITKVQGQREFRDKYCIIGEETGTNKQFVLSWADNFIAQQRIGAMLRTTIVSEYQARVTGIAQTSGISGASSIESTYQQEIDSVINTIINVSYSGAFREDDWWILRRRYDPDNKDSYTDEYMAWVLYTIPKVELNRQVARALETSVTRDSALYDITIEIARDLMQNGMASWGE